MFLWRFNTCSWVVMKFGGSGTNYFVYSGIATALVMNLIARRQAGRREFMEAYRLEKVPVVLCTVMAQVVMVSFTIQAAAVTASVTAAEVVAAAAAAWYTTSSTPCGIVFAQVLRQFQIEASRTRLVLAQQKAGSKQGCT
jgi:hypothetical protein